MPRPPLSLLTIHQVAELTGEHRTTVRRKLFELPVLPMEKRGKDEVFQSRPALLRVFGVESGSTHNPAMERARKDRADAVLKELAYQERTGELVRREEPARGYLALASTISARVQAVPTKIARELAAES